MDMSKPAKAQQSWPKRTNNLPSTVQAVFDAWEQCGEHELDEALDRIEGFTRPPGRLSIKQKYRDLTLMRPPLPPSSSAVPTLTASDVSVFFGQGVPPQDWDGGDSDSGSIRSTPSDDRMNSMKSSLVKCLDTIAKQSVSK
jgi:hypothetical protein